MLLVLSVVAVAAVLGYAMLSVTSLQRQVEANQRRGPEAESLAESGINLATYYLLHPESAPGYPGWANVNWYWPGTGGPIGFGAALGGTVNVVVTKVAATSWEYEITSTGVAASSAVSRTVKQRVYLNADYEVNHAAIFGNDVTLGQYGQIGAVGEPITVYARGQMFIKTGGKVFGNVYKGVFVPASQAQPFGGSFKALPVVPVVIPGTISEVRDYSTYKLPSDDTVYQAQIHNPDGGGLLEELLGILGLGSGGDVASLGPSATNPAGVHIINGDVELLSGAHVSGTLIVKGNLTLDIGTSACNLTSLRPDFPALVVGGNIDATPSSTVGSLNVTGACWVGGKIDGGAATNVNFNVTGALLCDGGLFPSSPSARSLIKYRPDLVKINDFTDKGRTPKSVRVLSWHDGR